MNPHGVASCAHWLQWQCGTTIGVAREKVRVARALPELPKISESFSKGRISYSKVRAMDELFEEQQNEPSDVSAETSRRMACDASVVHWHEARDGEIHFTYPDGRTLPPSTSRHVVAMGGRLRIVLPL